MSARTSRKQITYAQATDPVTEWPSVDKEASETVDLLNEGQGDFLQAGVVEASDWSFTATINNSTGVLASSGSTGGTAWLSDPIVSGALMRTVTEPKALSGLTPSKLPVTTKFMSIGVQLTAASWDKSATVSVVTGTEESTEALALENPAAPTTGNTRIKDIIVKNTSGTYSIVTQRDRRPWVRGAHCLRSTLESSYTTTSTEYVPISTGLSARIECTGKTLRASLQGVLFSTGTPLVSFTFLEDGVPLNPAPCATQHAEASARFLNLITYFSPSVGSHLFQPAWKVNESNASLGIAGQAPPPVWVVFVLDELTRPNANNGTS